MATREIAGATVEIDVDGYMTDHKAWNKEIAAAFAKEQGIDDLTDRHYIVIEFMRKHHGTDWRERFLEKVKQGGIDKVLL